MINLTYTQDSEIRIDRFLREKLRIPQSLVQTLLRKGKITINNIKCKETNHKLQPNEIVQIDYIINESTKTTKAINTRKHKITPDEISQMQNRVIFKNDHLIAINKPSGLAVQGGTKVNISVNDYLEHLKFGYIERPYITHRIDKDTSGILILARTRKYATIITKMFESKLMEKQYIAILSALPRQLKGKIEYKLSKDQQNGRVEVDQKDGLAAHTSYQVIQELAHKQCVAVLRPKTGRMHQLRVHTKSIGCTIVGDYKYGYNSLSGLKLFLHAQKIEFDLPFLDRTEHITIEAPLPHEFEQYIKQNH